MLCAGCDAQFRADTTGCLKSTRSGQTGVHRAPNAVSKAVSFVTLGSYSTSGGLRFFNVKVEVVMPDTHSGGCDGQTALDIHCSWQGTEGAPSLLPRFLLFLTAFFFFNFIYLFLAVLGLRFCARAFSGCGEQGPLFIAVRWPLTVAASPVAEHRLSRCGSRAQLLRGMWDLPGPGLEPVSPALAGRFATTAPPGKP